MASTLPVAVEMPSNPSLPGRSTLAALLIVTACGEGPDDTAHEAFASTTDAVEAFAPPTATEQSFLALLNSERNGNGLAPLIPYWDLVDDAREHSLDMISAGNIYHNPDLANVTAPGWSKLGENVGVGPTTSSLHAAFMASPGHAANVLGDYRYVGIGAQTSGAIWVTFVFMQHPDQTLGNGLPPFVDDEGHWAEAAIRAIFDAGITKGCNPPAGDRFCPEDVVNRAQMAVFLTRALGLTPLSDDPFVDDDGHWAEASIAAIAKEGITVGCNPPVNDRFCPDDPVTRAQMATFLTRALGLTPSSSSPFVDDDGHWAEANIAAIAHEGITKGCNPPAGDHFCPDDFVTRAQMAVFLKRAFL